MNPSQSNFPKILAAVFVLFFIALGIHPVDRTVWIAEVIPVIAIFLGLAATYKHFRFTNLAYALAAFWMFWHTIGGHYTFANVPFGWVTDLLGSDRNHFDRIGHFSVGFFAYGAAELIYRKRWAGKVLATTCALFFIMAIAAGYEIIEWIYAVTQGGNAGIEFLGSQGDVWDAQKDMLADTLGAVVVLVWFWVKPPAPILFWGR